MSIFGNRLKNLRLEKQLTGEELGNALNVTKVAISNWESGNRSPHHEMLSKIARYFDVSVDYLLGNTDERNLHKEKTKLDPSIKTIAAHRLGDIEDLDDDAIDKINEYIEFIRMQHKKK